MRLKREKKQLHERDFNLTRLGNEFQYWPRTIYDYPVLSELLIDDIDKTLKEKDKNDN